MNTVQTKEEVILKRTMVVCRTSSIGPGCGTRWVELEYKKVHTTGYMGRMDYHLERKYGSRCPTCLGNNTYFQRLEVKKNHGGKCATHCQVSDSKKCACACGGKRHGEALDPFMVYL